MLAAGYRRIGVAVSGGADSVFLLHALQELGLAAAVLHVNHGLRGAGIGRATKSSFAIWLSASDCRFTFSQRPSPTGNIEQEARRARYDFFARANRRGELRRRRHRPHARRSGGNRPLPLPARRGYRGSQRNSSR